MSERCHTLPSASVVIPTYNRLDTLTRVIDALGQEIVDSEFAAEVVVVDDGSHDGTWAWLRRRTAQLQWLVPIRQDNSGPARARNQGVNRSRHELVLFLGDDTVPSPGWLRAHLEEHRLFGGDRQLAVVGYTGLPTSDDRAFSRFVNEYGAQFGYALIEQPTAVPFNFFYTSNISLSRDAFTHHGGFREDFPAAAWEDIEFAYRAAAAGLGLRYQPRARTVHHHRVRPRTFCHRQRTSGQSGAIFAELHPELSHFLGVHMASRRSLPARFLHRALGLCVRLGEIVPGVVPVSCYQRYLDLAYWEGLADGLHHQRSEVHDGEDSPGTSCRGSTLGGPRRR